MAADLQQERERPQFGWLSICEPDWYDWKFSPMYSETVEEQEETSVQCRLLYHNNHHPQVRETRTIQTLVLVSCFTSFSRLKSINQSTNLSTHTFTALDVKLLEVTHLLQR